MYLVVAMAINRHNTSADCCHCLHYDNPVLKKPGILSLPDHAILVPYSQPRNSHGATDR